MGTLLPVNHTPDNALTAHSSLACPVCLDLWPEAQTDDVTITHLLTHTARELAFALLACDARRCLTRLALEEARPHPVGLTASRYDLHLVQLIDGRREYLLGQDTP